MHGKVSNKLTTRLINSDENAFDELFRTLYPELVKFSYKYLQEKQSASDIVQQAFINLWQKRKTLNPNESVKPYMYKIVRNLSLNLIRDEPEMQYVSDQEFNEIYEIAEIEEDQKEDQKEDIYQSIKMIEEWVMQLPEKQKNAIVLAKFEGLNQDEIAEVMNVSKNTVNNHIVAGINNIKRLYSQQVKNLL